MATNGNLNFANVNKVTFEGVGGASNAVIDTTTGKIGVGVDSPDANLHVVGNCFVSTNFELGGTMTMGTVTVRAQHELSAITATGNTTPHTVEFQNATTGIVTTGNVEVGGELAVSGNVAVDTDTLFVDSVNDRVGVGTTNPEVPFNVVGNNTLSGNPNNAIASFRATTAIPGTNDAGVVIGSTNGNSPYIADVSTASVGLSFYTQNAERMRINSSGNVGIGTMDPSRNLHVFHPTYGVHRSIYWTEKPGDPATQNPIQMGYLGSSDPSHASGGLGLFKNTYEGGAEDEAVRIQANGNSWFNGGNVGIGNRNPQSKLDIFDTGGCTLRLTTDSATPQGTIDIIRGDNLRSPSDYTFGASNYYDWRIGSDDTTSYNFAIRRKGAGLDTKVLVIDGTTGNTTINGTITYNTKQATHQQHGGLAYTTANLGQNIKSVTISADGIAHVHVSGLWKLDAFDGTNGSNTDAIYFSLKKNSTEITASAVGHRMAKLGNSNDTDQWRPIVLSWSGAVSSGDQIHVYTAGVENSFSMNELDLNVLVV